MTKKLDHPGKSTKFSDWLRIQPEIDSKLGYVCTNIDFLWKNYKTGQWMFIEEKTRGGKASRAQAEMFFDLHVLCLKSDPLYCGFHLVVFENESPDDGRIWWKTIVKKNIYNTIEISRDQLIKRLMFVGDPAC